MVVSDRLLSGVTNERAASRANLLLSATLVAEGKSNPVRMRNLSCGGALVECPTLPENGAKVELVRGGLRATATVAWTAQGHCGLRFDRPVATEAWLSGGTARDQLRVDQIVAQLRAPGAPREPPATAAPPNVEALPNRLAEELAYVARLLDGLGDALAGEPIVLARYMTKLQDLDISAQILGHVATVLVSSEPAKAVEQIGMESLRRRLQRGSL